MLIFRKRVSRILPLILAAALAGCGPTDRVVEVEPQPPLTDAEAKAILEEVAKTGIPGEGVSRLHLQIAEDTESDRENRQEIIGKLEMMIVGGPGVDIKKVAQEVLEMW